MTSERCSRSSTAGGGSWRTTLSNGATRSAILDNEPQTGRKLDRLTSTSPTQRRPRSDHAR
jgi:hypothetical protein